MAFVGIGREPVAGVGPLVADWRGGSRGDGERGAGAVFDAFRRRGGFAVSELFGRGWVGVEPKATAILPRFQFSGGVGGSRVETLIMPRQTGTEHFKVDVELVNVDRAEDASVLVALSVFDADVLAEDERRKMLLRDIAECLRLLRRVDALKPNLVLDIRRVEDRDRVAVGDLYDAAVNLRIIGHAANTEKSRECRRQNQHSPLHVPSPRDCTSCRRGDRLACMKKERTILSCTQPKPDQRPETNARRENAPSWAHPHLHAARF